MGLEKCNLQLDDNIYFVKRLKKRRKRCGKRQVQVEWVNWAKLTWEDEASIKRDCPGLFKSNGRIDKSLVGALPPEIASLKSAKVLKILRSEVQGREQGFIVKLLGQENVEIPEYWISRNCILQAHQEAHQEFIASHQPGASQAISEKSSEEFPGSSSALGVCNHKPAMGGVSNGEKDVVEANIQNIPENHAVRNPTEAEQISDESNPLIQEPAKQRVNSESQTALPSPANPPLQQCSLPASAHHLNPVQVELEEESLIAKINSNPNHSNLTSKDLPPTQEQPDDSHQSQEQIVWFEYLSGPTTEFPYISDFRVGRGRSLEFCVAWMTDDGKLLDLLIEGYRIHEVFPDPSVMNRFFERWQIFDRKTALNKTDGVLSNIQLTPIRAFQLFENRLRLLIDTGNGDIANLLAGEAYEKYKEHVDAFFAQFPLFDKEFCVSRQL